MPDQTPIILWFRRDLRLSDHPALHAACETGRPVIPVFIHDEVVETHGAAPLFRLGLSVDALSQSLSRQGSRLILRRGNALETLKALILETGATDVWWSRLYDPDSVKRDTGVKQSLKADGIGARSFGGHVLFEPWSVETGTGGYYRVFTPLWKAVRGREVLAPISKPTHISAPETWPATERLAQWNMDGPMKRGADILREYCCVGEDAAHDRLETFINERVAFYANRRDVPSVNGTSGLSENLTYGEISSARCWHAGWRALHNGAAQAETFLKELVWREFAYHLSYHTPHIVSDNWKPEWDAFPWSTEISSDVGAWQQGRTGIPFVDAAMREMYVTGVMHNRGRMIVASYLTKHLMTHWRIGCDWFADTLIDWDPCSNAMGWQWSAGSGPDATPYFRVFNPDTQLEKFDKEKTYVRRWIAELGKKPPRTAMHFFEMIPRHWGLKADAVYPAPIVSLADGRKRALDAYAARKS